jgi:hypothetical protein
MESRVETILFLPGTRYGVQHRLYGRYLQIHQHVKGDENMTENNESPQKRPNNNHICERARMKGLVCRLWEYGRRFCDECGIEDFGK